MSGDRFSAQYQTLSMSDRRPGSGEIYEFTTFPAPDVPTPHALYDPYDPANKVDAYTPPAKSASMGEYLPPGGRMTGTPEPIGGLPKPPVRRYSGEWWARGWDARVKHGLVPRLIYTITGFALIGIWIGVIVNFVNREQKHQDANEERDFSVMQQQNRSTPGNLLLQGMLRKFDDETKTLTVQWSAVYLNDDNRTVTSMGLTDETSWPIGLYRDALAIYDNETTMAYNDGEYYYRVDNATAPRLGVLAVHEWDSVDTDIDMSAETTGDVWKEPLFGYPWDEWSGEIVLIGTDMILGELSSDFANGTAAFLFSGITLVDTILNWKIEAISSYAGACDDQTPAEQQTCGLKVHFTARRPGMVIFSSIVVVIVNWLSTIAVFLLTGEVILLRRSHILEGTDILGVLFASLFALPSVRSLLPAAPTQFGAVIDLIGILPNVIIISLCTATFCVAKLMMRLKAEIWGPGSGSQSMG